MGFNSSIVTETARAVTEQSIVDYANGVFAHTAGDWYKHNCLKILSSAGTGVQYKDSNNDIVAYDTLRLELTDTGGNPIQAVMPIANLGDTTLEGKVPIIVTQPKDVVARTFGVANFTVAAISDTTMTYQWRKDTTVPYGDNMVNINGATSASYTVASSQSTDDGAYDVVVQNIYGTVVSSKGTLSRVG